MQLAAARAIRMGKTSAMAIGSWSSGTRHAEDRHDTSRRMVVVLIQNPVQRVEVVLDT